MRYFGPSSGDAAAIGATLLMDGYAADKHSSRGGRPDLSSPFLIQRINVPTLLIVGAKDSRRAPDLNKKALKLMKNSREKRLIVVPNAGIYSRS